MSLEDSVSTSSGLHMVNNQQFWSKNTAVRTVMLFGKVAPSCPDVLPEPVHAQLDPGPMCGLSFSVGVQSDC